MAGGWRPGLPPEGPPPSSGQDRLWALPHFVSLISSSFVGGSRACSCPAGSTHLLARSLSFSGRAAFARGTYGASAAAGPAAGRLGEHGDAHRLRDVPGAQSLRAHAKGELRAAPLTSVHPTDTRHRHRPAQIEYGGTCHISGRPYTVFRWKPGNEARYKKTIVCQEVAKAKNVCQVSRAGTFPAPPPVQPRCCLTTPSLPSLSTLPPGLPAGPRLQPACASARPCAGHAGRGPARE